MLDKIKLFFLNQKQKLAYIEKKGHKIGYRNFNGSESVLYMIGTIFVEVVLNKRGSDQFVFFNNVSELKRTYGQQFQSLA